MVGAVGGRHGERRQRLTAWTPTRRSTGDPRRARVESGRWRSGANLAGAAVVGIDTQAAGGQATWILEHANVSFLIVDSLSQSDKIPVNVQDRLTIHSWFSTTSLGQASAGARGGRDRDYSGRCHANLLDTDRRNPGDADLHVGDHRHTESYRVHARGDIMTACWAMVDGFPDLPIHGWCAGCPWPRFSSAC